MIARIVNNSTALVRHSIAIVFSLIAMIVVIYVDTRKEAALDDQKLQAIVDGVADSVDRQLASWRLSLSAMAASSDLDEPYDIVSFANEAKRFANLTGTNISFFRLEDNGLKLYAHTQVAVEDLPQYYPIDRISNFYDASINVQKTGEPQITDFFVGAIAGELLSSIVISKTRQPNSNELLSLNFTSSYLSHILDQIQLPKDYIIGLVDKSGVIGARSENYKEFVGKVIPQDTLRIYQEEEKGIVRGDAVRGATHDTYRISFRRLKEAKRWTISLLVPPNNNSSVVISPFSVGVAFLSLVMSNALAWGFGAAQRQRTQLEESYRLSTRRLLNELPGAILRGRFDFHNQFQVTLAFGQLANHIFKDGMLRFGVQLQSIFIDSVTSGSDLRSHECDISDGGKVYRIFITRSSADSAEEIEYNVYIFDISKQRSAEIAAINSARLAALGQMAATLAHEMSQPLNVIALAAENADSLIADQDTERAQTKIHKIKEFAIKSRKLIDNLLVYSRGDSEEPLPIAVNLRRSIDLALDLTGPMLRLHNIEISVEIEDVDIQVLARPVELENIFVNLVMNAVDAFNQSQLVAHPKIKIAAHKIDDGVQILVSDNAGGISNTILERVFDPFVTTKPVGHGTGLGLAFVLGNVRAWGGNISARNHDDGAEFELRLKQHIS